MREMTNESSNRALRSDASVEAESGARSVQRGRVLHDKHQCVDGHRTTAVLDWWPHGSAGN